MTLKKNLYKLLNNAFYGKSSKNVRNRVKIELIRKDDNEELLYNNQLYHSMEFINCIINMIVNI